MRVRDRPKLEYHHIDRALIRIILCIGGEADGISFIVGGVQELVKACIVAVGLVCAGNHNGLTCHCNNEVVKDALRRLGNLGDGCLPQRVGVVCLTILEVFHGGDIPKRTIRLSVGDDGIAGGVVRRVQHIRTDCNHLDVNIIHRQGVDPRAVCQCHGDGIAVNKVERAQINEFVVFIVSQIEHGIRYCCNAAVGRLNFSGVCEVQ